jgi:DNA modification methylase
MSTTSRVLHGDAILVLQRMEANSIDCLITDPPYSIGVTSHGNVQSWLDNIMLHPFWTSYFAEVQRVLKDGASVYINCDWRTYPFIYPYAARFLNVRNCIVWDYEWIKAGSHYRFSHEFVIYATKGDAKRSFDAGKENRDVWRIPPMNFTRKDKRHQAEKPEALVEKMILNSTAEGDVILDTFVGSGTTGAVAKRLNRSFVGIELNPDYIELATTRIG